MAYCTQSDILKKIPEDVLIELTDDDGAGSVDTDNVDRAIADADEEIDAFISMRYSLPFSTTPAMIRRISVDLAIENLYGRRPTLDVPENLVERCRADRKILEKLADGKLKLDIPDPTADTDFGIETTSDKTDRVFTIGRDSNSSSGSMDNF